MTIFETGAVGEFAGAIFLFLSLIYVGIQVTQHTNSMDESRSLALAQTRFAAAGKESVRNVTGIERMRYSGWNLGYASNADNWFYQYQQGFFPRDHYDTRITGIIKKIGIIWQAQERL